MSEAAELSRDLRSEAPTKQERDIKGVSDTSEALDAESAPGFATNQITEWAAALRSAALSRYQ